MISCHRFFYVTMLHFYLAFSVPLPASTPILSWAIQLNDSARRPPNRLRCGTGVNHVSHVSHDQMRRLHLPQTRRLTSPSPSLSSFIPLLPERFLSYYVSTLPDIPFRVAYRGDSASSMSRSRIVPLGLIIMPWSLVLHSPRALRLSSHASVLLS